MVSQLIKGIQLGDLHTWDKTLGLKEIQKTLNLNFKLPREKWF